MVRPSPAQYRPAAKCIYCGEADSPLSREHIIPYGLDGDHVLPKASCRNCAEITKGFEEAYMRGPIWPVRIALKFTSRRPRPSLIPINTNEGQRLIPPEDYPAVIVLPALDVPGIMRSAAPDADIQSRPWVRILQVQGDNLAKHGIKGAWTIPLHLPTLARVLAKIAHSYACAVLGTETFEPFLLDIILKGSDRPWFYIGGSLDILPAPQDGALHEVGLSYYQFDDAPDLFSVDVRLFAKFGAPTYKIIVGCRRAVR